MLKSAVKWRDLSNRMSIIIRRYIDHMRFSSYIAVLLVTVFRFFWFYFVLLYTWLYGLYTFV